MLTNALREGINGTHGTFKNKYDITALSDESCNKASTKVVVKVIKRTLHFENTARVLNFTH